MSALRKKADININSKRTLRGRGASFPGKSAYCAERPPEALAEPFTDEGSLPGTLLIALLVVFSVWPVALRAVVFAPFTMSVLLAPP